MVIEVNKIQKKVVLLQDTVKGREELMCHLSHRGQVAHLPSGFY